MAKQHYRAFLLRLWRADNDDIWLWRASLEDAHSGERHGFGDLFALQEFLRTLLEPQLAEQTGRAAVERSSSEAKGS